MSQFVNRPPAPVQDARAAYGTARHAPAMQQQFPIGQSHVLQQHAMPPPPGPTSTTIGIPSGSVSEVIPVPKALEEWFRGDTFQPVLLKVKEQTGVNYFRLNVDPADQSATLWIYAPTAESARMARLLVEVNFKQQLKLLEAERNLYRMRHDLSAVQTELVTGMRTEFVVPEHLVGVMIGKKGARVTEIIKQSGVKNISVDGGNGRVTIVGTDAQSVERAREMFEVFEENMEIAREDMEQMLKDYSLLNELKSSSGVIVATLLRNPDRVMFIGSRTAIACAKIVVGTQLEYLHKRMRLLEDQRELRKELSTFRKPTYGAAPSTPNTGTGASSGNTSKAKITGGISSAEGVKRTTAIPSPSSANPAASTASVPIATSGSSKRGARTTTDSLANVGSAAAPAATTNPSPKKDKKEQPADSKKEKAAAAQVTAAPAVAVSASNNGTRGKTIRDSLQQMNKSSSPASPAPAASSAPETAVSPAAKDAGSKKKGGKAPAEGTSSVSNITAETRPATAAPVVAVTESAPAVEPSRSSRRRGNAVGTSVLEEAMSKMEVSDKRSGSTTTPEPTAPAEVPVAATGKTPKKGKSTPKTQQEESTPTTAASAVTAASTTTPPPAETTAPAKAAKKGKQSTASSPADAAASEPKSSAAEAPVIADASSAAPVAKKAGKGAKASVVTTGPTEAAPVAVDAAKGPSVVSEQPSGAAAQEQQALPKRTSARKRAGGDETAKA